MIQTVDAERCWWDSLTDAEVPANVAHCDTQACLTEIRDLLGPLPEHARVLDLGCGPGRLAIPLARSSPSTHIVGMDISRRMLDKARVTRARHGLRNCVFLLGDGRTIPPVAGHFDAAYSMLVFQHLPPDACAGYVREVAAMLRPGAPFAYQVVIGDSADSFLSHQCASVNEPFGWMHAAGFDHVDAYTSRIYEAWEWIVATKPEAP